MRSQFENVGIEKKRVEVGSFEHRKMCFGVDWRKEVDKNQRDPCVGWESTWEHYYCSFIKL